MGGRGEAQRDQDCYSHCYFSSALLSCPWALILDYQMGNDCLDPSGKAEHVPGGNSLGSKALAAMWMGEPGECTQG